MVDTVQNLTGTTASVVVPEAPSAPQVSTSGAGSPVEVGTTAPVVAVTETETNSISIDVNSAMGDVMRAMKDMPPPIDLEAVQRLRAEIAQNDYPVDYDKISDALISSLNEIV
ncbi:MAG: flagellar biosynthesis anti-sigma factor FlgM [Proteobacteria bacterium]|nr:flagellar biosynthesis anti-sigma factor FlgM [Pseudomonadota bacterium]